MLDLNNIPSQQQQTYMFYATGNWQTWSKPRNAKIIEIFCLGGGGGGGRPNGSSTSNTGGGGGASGGITRGIIPAILLPDTLYVFPGKGGLGATTNNTAGASGGISYVSLQASTSEQTLICKSSNSVPGGGGVSLGAPAPTTANIPLSAFGNLGLFSTISGVAGSNGGSSTPGTSQTALATSIVTGGAGGGGRASSTTFTSGGNILSASSILTTQVNGGVVGGSAGDSGYGIFQPFCGTGGAGGCGSTSSGGRGGDGWYGCGGAGGGSGTIGSTGNGGNGGDGIVIITVIC
jgi:hypothetical protein